MIFERAIVTLKRGRYDKEFEGNVFAFDEKDRWYFMPDGAPGDDVFWAYGATVRVSSPTKEFRARDARAVDGETARAMIHALEMALEGQ